MGARYKAASRRATTRETHPGYPHDTGVGRTPHTHCQKKLAAISIRLYPSPGVTDVVMHNKRSHGFERCHTMVLWKTVAMVPDIEAPSNRERPRYRTVYARWILRVFPVHIWRNAPEAQINFLRKIGIEPQTFKVSPLSLTGCSLPSQS